MLAVEPSRLFIDAKTTAEWRAKGFSPVLNEAQGSPEANLENSVLYQMLRLKLRNPQPRIGMLPESFALGLDRDQTCPTREQFDDYAEEHPLWGMPYAMPNLEQNEYRTLVQWLAQGSPTSTEPEVAEPARAQIENWERFLNSDSMKQRLVSRYIYEHLFVAYLHFDDTPDRDFYRLVRSRTPPGVPVHDVATVRPYDDPGPEPFHYRFAKLRSSIVAKDHIVYALSDDRMQRYRKRERPYLEAREEYFKQVHAADLPNAMGHIWDGDGENPSAALTVFRHFDSASVSFGLIGDDPKTAWIIDYPLLERIHYLLVAGFNIFGNVGHQLNTRLYMDFLRMEGEYGFLAFLPVSHRKAIHDSWYRGMRSDLEEHVNAPMDWLTVESVVGYQSDDPAHDLAYTLIRNKAYENVSSLSSDGADRDRKDEERDTLTVVTWLEGSYPNFFFSLDLERIDDFVHRYEAIRNREDYDLFVELYGVRRTDAGFWSTADWFHDQYAREQPIASGLFDLNRYETR